MEFCDGQLLLCHSQSQNSHELQMWNENLVFWPAVVQINEILKPPGRAS